MGGQLRRVGYLRTCNYDPIPDVQAKALQQAGCDPANIYQANSSEPFATPAGRKRLLNFLERGDERIVYRLDRLSRDEHTLTILLEQLQANGITLKLIDQMDGGDSE